MPRIPPRTSVGRPFTTDPAILDSASFTVPSAALNGWAGRVVNPGSWLVSIIRFGVTVSSGNIALAAWNDSGSESPGTLLALTNSIVCPPAGVATAGFLVANTIKQGDWIGLYADNVTATFWGKVNPAGMLVPTWRGVRLTAIANLNSVASNPGTATDTRMLTLAGN